MQCQSCKEEVLAKFVHAISVNSCPFCGGEIVSSEVKAIMNTLSLAFNDAKNHMSQIEDWLMTNYSLRLIKDNEVVINKDDLPVAVRSEEHKGTKKPSPLKRAGSDADEEDGVLDEP